MVWAINRTDDLLLVGDEYLFPGEGRLVPDYIFDAARDRYGAGLVSSLTDDGLADDDEDADRYDDLSLDVFDEADAADLERMNRSELVETARLHGIVPGRMTKRDLIDAIRSVNDSE